jgi:hypothetical protein
LKQKEAETFLTATDVADREVFFDIEPSVLAIEPEPNRTIDEMLADLNDFSDNFRRDHDDLEELRRRIAHTRKGINEHTTSTHKLKSTIMELDEASRGFSHYDHGDTNKLTW